MPSNKDPNAVVNPGPGRLPAGTVPASSLILVGGGGSDAALTAHISNPHDAHMASAIGIHAFYAPTGQPLLSSVGGPYDGESVEDALASLSALIPPKPNAVGFNNIAIPNSGTPSWGSINTRLTGGFAIGPNVRWSNYLMANGTSSFNTSGILYPADRGVLALYASTNGDYFNPGGMTLVAALWLGANPPPVGIPGANFIEASRLAGQTNYTAANAGIDLISLTFRLPYLTNYVPFGSPYTPYGQNFPAFQLATYAIASQALAGGSSGSFLLVQWRESFATSLAAIQPVNVTVGTLTSVNCYSATPVASDFDTGVAVPINRRYVYRDTNSGATPTGFSWSSAQNGSPSSVPLSGVQFYDNVTPLTWNVDMKADGLFANSFLTGSVSNPPDVPAAFVAANDPVLLTFAAFGGSSTKVPYYDLKKDGVPGNYSATNAPQIADRAEYVNGTLPIPSPSSASPSGGYGQLRAVLQTAFHNVAYLDTTRYLFNSYPQSSGTLSTQTFEPFVDEHYRYAATFDPTTSATVPIVPAGGNVFASATPFVSGGSDLQVVGNVSLYPQTNFSSGYAPAAQPDYASVLSGDASNHIRYHLRAFNTGVARNTGKLRIRGLAFSAFNSANVYSGNLVTDHTGGALVQIKVPGGSGTGWLDVGRVKGDPDLATTDYRGCRTALSTVGPDVFVTYDTTTFTSDNGSGVFLLFVRVGFIKGPGTSLSIDELEWQSP